MTNFLCHDFKLNKAEEPFGGVVERFKAQFLKTRVDLSICKPLEIIFKM